MPRFDIPLADVVALMIFIALRLGYGPLSQRLGHQNVNHILDHVRDAWMRRMLERDMRMADSTLIGHVIHSASFFASTSIILIAGMIGALTNLDRLQPAMEAVGAFGASSRALTEIKIFAVIAVLVDGFFKFTWALRQLNYTVALMGAAPPPDTLGDAREGLATAIGRVLSNAIMSFNDGIRGYYFAIAILGWIAGPIAFVIVTLGVVIILIRRQTVSATAQALRLALPPIRQGLDADQTHADQAPADQTPADQTPRA